MATIIGYEIDPYTGLEDYDKPIYDIDTSAPSYINAMKQVAANTRAYNRSRQQQPGMFGPGYNGPTGIPAGTSPLPIPEKPREPLVIVGGPGGQSPFGPTNQAQPPSSTPPTNLPPPPPPPPVTPSGPSAKDLAIADELDRLMNPSYGWIKDYYNKQFQSQSAGIRSGINENLSARLQSMAAGTGYSGAAEEYRQKAIQNKNLGLNQATDAAKQNTIGTMNERMQAGYQDAMNRVKEIQDAGLRSKTEGIISGRLEDWKKEAEKGLWDKGVDTVKGIWDSIVG